MGLVMQGLIARRILVNFQVPLNELARVVPPPFRPLNVRGVGLAGVCLIRLEELRPRGLPRWFGLSSENAAYRVAVEWDQAGESHRGVYIPRRETSSRINALVGGRLFPGWHFFARFVTREIPRGYQITLQRPGGVELLSLEVVRATRLAANSVFSSLGEASEFFRQGSIGYSPCPVASRFEGLELDAADWRVEPLRLDNFRSTEHGLGELFSSAGTRWDSALLMTRISHCWRTKPPLEVGANDTSSAPAQPDRQGQGFARRVGIENA